MPGIQITSGVMSVNISFAIHARGSILMLKSPDQSPNSTELVLMNNLGKYQFSVDIPLNILLSESGIIGEYDNYQLDIRKS